MAQDNRVRDCGECGTRLYQRIAICDGCAREAMLSESVHPPEGEVLYPAEWVYAGVTSAGGGKWWGAVYCSWACVGEIANAKRLAGTGA